MLLVVLAPTITYVKVTIYLDVPVVQQPEVYIAETPALFGENGEFLQEGTEAFLQTAVDAFVNLVDKLG